ncbi:MAG: DUF4870 domain-containing protein [Christensenellales bacterium]|jgi:uncharacterized membrane protein
MATKYQAHKCYLGDMNANIVVGLGYLLPPLGIVSHFLEKNSNFVRYAGMQSLVIAAVLATAWILNFIFSYLGIFGIVMNVFIYIVEIATVVFAIIAAVNGFKYQEYDIPLISQIARNLMTKF